MFDGATMVGKLVSIMTRSGALSAELILMDALYVAVTGAHRLLRQAPADSDQQQDESAADESEILHQRHRPPPFGDDLETSIDSKKLKVD